MGYLLDTHAALWWLMEPDRLAQKARKIMADPETEIHISAASMFEIAQKVRVGKLDYPRELVTRFPSVFREQSWQPLEISIEHALRAGSFEAAHRDPFDRLLAAQAELDSLMLLTNDPKFDQFPVTVIWD